MPAHGKQCRITNCKNRVYHHGNICATHRYRMKKFGSYDLPGYKGIPNKFVIPVLPEGIVKECIIHGYLNSDQAYTRKYKGKNHYACKNCILNKNIKRKYQGMNSLDDYDIMLTAQSGVCGICKGQNNTTRNGKIKRFNVDHDHSTSKVRGLLCTFCNALIGYARDDVKILQAAINYLKDHQYFFYG